MLALKFGDLLMQSEVSVYVEHLHAVLIYFPTVLYVPTYQASSLLPTNNNASYSYDITWHLTLFFVLNFLMIFVQLFLHLNKMDITKMEYNTF